MLINPLFRREQRKNQGSGTFNKEQTTAGKTHVDKGLLWRIPSWAKLLPARLSGKLNPVPKGINLLIITSDEHLYHPGWVIALCQQGTAVNWLKTPFHCRMRLAYLSDGGEKNRIILPQRKMLKEIWGRKVGKASRFSSEDLLRNTKHVVREVHSKE